MADKFLPLFVCGEKLGLSITFTQNLSNLEDFFMTMTFTRSLLATAVMVGLTACGSGGGNSGNNGATNSSTNTSNGVFNGEKVSEVQREQPTTPKVEPAKPTETATTPNVEPAKPVETAMTPNVEPAKPVETATTPNVEPAKPVETATTPNVEPAKPSETATTPTVEPAKPSETITVPVVTPTTENTPKEVVWDKLPAVPKFEESSISGYGSNLKGKATYLSQNIDASAKINGNNISSKIDGKSYVILNADFDNKKINGSAVFNFYSSDDVKKAQAELEFKEAALYKNDNRVAFNSEATGKILTETLKTENLSGSYGGETNRYDGDDIYFKYDVSSSDKNIEIIGSQTLYKQ